MSIKIHHGAPGSYKTSGAVLDDFIPAVLEGRLIYTNVNGLCDPDLIREVLEDRGKVVPDTFRLIHLDTTSGEVMEQVRRWWHWAEEGAFFLFDEIQLIYPAEFSPGALKKMDYPGGLDAATTSGCFLTVAQAFEQHRHKNWDFVLTTPNITKVHKLIRGCAEMGFRHKNLAVLGALFAGSFIEANHDPNNSGRAKADVYIIQRRRIPKYVFKLYKSTQTGKVSDTKAGKSIFKEPKVLLLLSVLGLSLAYSLSNGLPSFLSGSPQAPSARVEVVPGQTALDAQESIQGAAGAPASGVASAPVSGVGTAAPAGSNPAHVGAKPVPKVSVPSWLTLFQSADAVYLTNVYQQGKKLYYSVMLDTKKGIVIISESGLRDLGLKLTFLDRCLARLVSSDTAVYDVMVSCPPSGWGAPKEEGIDTESFENPFSTANGQASG